MSEEIYKAAIESLQTQIGQLVGERAIFIADFQAQQAQTRQALEILSEQLKEVMAERDDLLLQRTTTDDFSVVEYSEAAGYPVVDVDLTDKLKSSPVIEVEVSEQPGHTILGDKPFPGVGATWSPSHSLSADV